MCAAANGGPGGPGRLCPSRVWLGFGPNDRPLGRQFVDDCCVDEEAQTMREHRVVDWLARFPHWTGALTARLLPATPEAPGVAAVVEGAVAEGVCPERALARARARGVLLGPEDLPRPWGVLEWRDVESPVPDVARQGYAPPPYPGGADAFAEGLSACRVVVPA